MLINSQNTQTENSSEILLRKKHLITDALEQRLQSEHNIDTEFLIHACSILPWNYNYEIPKTIDKILTCKTSQNFS